MATTRKAILTLIEEYGTYFILNEEFVREYNRIINESADTFGQPSNVEQQTISPTGASEGISFVNYEQETPPTESHQDKQTNSRRKGGITLNDFDDLCNYLNQPENISLGSNFENGVKISEAFFQPNYLGLKVLYRFYMYHSIKLKKLRAILLCYDNKNNIIIMKTKQFDSIVSQIAFFLITKTDYYDLFQIDHISLNIVGEP